MYTQVADIYIGRWRESIGESWPKQQPASLIIIIISDRRWMTDDTVVLWTLPPQHSVPYIVGHVEKKSTFVFCVRTSSYCAQQFKRFLLNALAGWFQCCCCCTTASKLGISFGVPLWDVWRKLVQQGLVFFLFVDMGDFHWPWVLTRTGKTLLSHPTNFDGRWLLLMFCRSTLKMFF